MPKPDEWAAGSIDAIAKSDDLARAAWWIALGLVGVATICAFVIRVDRSVEGVGEVRPEGGTWTAQAPWPGQIAAVMVEEGALVRVGEPLARMDLSELEIRRSGLRKLKELADKDLEVNAGRAPQAKIRGEIAENTALAELERAKSVHKSATIDVTFAKRDYDTMSSLGTSVSRKEVEEARGKWEKTQAALDVADKESGVAASKVELARKQAQQEVEDLDAKIRDATRQVADYTRQVDEVERKIKEGTVIAACAGKVMKRPIRAPSMVEAGAPLFEVVPLDAPAVLDVRVQSFEAAELAKDQTAQARFAGRNELVAGKVYEVSADAETVEGRSYHRVGIRLEPSKERLLFGLKGNVVIRTTKTTVAKLIAEALWGD